MTDDNPSAALQEAVAKAAREAIKDSFDDWDFTASIEKAYQQYLRDTLAVEQADPLGPWYLSSHPDGVVVTFALLDENTETILSADRDLFCIADAMYEDCFRSQSDIIFGIEQAVAKLKESFEARHGIPCERDAIERRTKELWP